MLREAGYFISGLVRLQEDEASRGQGCERARLREGEAARGQGFERARLRGDNDEGRAVRQGGATVISWTRFLLLSRWSFCLSYRYSHIGSVLDLLESSAGGAVVCILDLPEGSAG